jgi:TonB family protein
MPITETPTSSPDRPPDRPSKRKRSRYDELEPHELFSLIEEYEDERAKARLRESIWISIIVYMVLTWYLFYGPRYLFHQPHVINPSDALRDRKDLTYLDLPPDALKQVKPKNAPAISDKNRIAQSKQPTLDKKTLEELEAMRKARAAEKAAPPSQQPAAPPQQQAAQQSEPQQKPSQPLPQNQQSAVEAPTPAPKAPSMNSGAMSPGEAIREAAREARGAGGGEGEYGQGAQPRHPGLQSGYEILSDTLGVDFGPYMQRVIRETYRAWDPLIPEAVRPPLSKQGRVYIQFIIAPDGSVKNMKLIGPSGDVSLDRAAWGAITGSNYPTLPKEFKGPYLELRFAFLYNPKKGE